MGIDYTVRVLSEVLKKQKYPIVPTKLTFVPDAHVCLGQSDSLQPNRQQGIFWMVVVFVTSPVNSIRGMFVVKQRGISSEF